MAAAILSKSRFLPFWGRLVLLGLAGVASLLFVPIEDFVPIDVDPLALRLLATVQPALLVMVLAAVGAWAAPQVGLDAPVFRAWAEGRPVAPALRRQAPAAVSTGLAVAAVLVGFVTVLRGTGIGDDLLRFAIPLPTRLLYGGITEELLIRWGLMSLFVWLAWRAAGRRLPVPGWCYGTGLSLAAILFAAGHLPTLWLLIPDAPDWLAALVLLCNFVPGLLLGSLFWRRGLESAIAAHALAHLFAWSVLLIL